jgi:hypothetical protein
VYTGFWWGNLKERDHLKYPDVDGRIILKWIFGKCDGGMDWIDLIQDRDRWRALVKAGNEDSGSIKCGNYLTSSEKFSLLIRTVLHGVSK